MSIGSRFRQSPLAAVLLLSVLGCTPKLPEQSPNAPKPTAPIITESDSSPEKPADAPKPNEIDVGLSPYWKAFQKTDLIDEALRVMDLLVERFPDSADSHEARARVQLLIGQTAEAKKSWERCLELVPNYGYAFHGLGLIETKFSRYKEAIALYQKALETIPNYRDSVRELSDAYLKDGQPELSAKILEAYLLTKPDDSEFSLRLGQSYNAALQFDKAKIAFEKSLSLADDNPKAEQGLMIALLRLGERDRAKELAEKAKQRPIRENDSIEELLKNERIDIANRYWFASLVYRSFKRFNESSLLLERAHQYNPNSTQVIESLIEHALREKTLDQAYSYSKLLLDLDQTNPSYSFGAGAIAEKLNRNSDAANHYRKVIELAPRDPKAYRQLITICLTSKNNLAEAESLAQAWSGFDETAIPLAYLASVQAMQNKLTEAEMNLSKALALDPTSKELQQRLAEVRKELRTSTEAIP